MLPQLDAKSSAQQEALAEQLFSESLHSQRLPALRRQAAARLAAPATRMSALLGDADDDDELASCGAEALPAALPAKRSVETASLEECVELAVSVALEGNRALLLVSNVPLVAKLLAAALQRRRVDAKTVEPADADFADPFYSPLRCVTLMQCRDAFHALCELDGVERAWVTESSGFRLVVLAPLCELLGPFATTAGLSVAGEGVRRMLQLALKRVRVRSPAQLRVIRPPPAAALAALK